jgi:hypothetical protein
MPGGGSPFVPVGPLPVSGGPDDGLLLLFIVGALVWFALCAGLGLLLRGPGGMVGEQTMPFAPPASRNWTVPPMQDLILSADEVADKSVRTTRLLEMLARTDGMFDPGPLRAWVGDLFCRVQQCWQDRNPGPVKEQMTPHAQARYAKLIETMRQRHLINHVNDLYVRRLEFVHVARMVQADGHEFTALITFEAKAHFVNETTGVPIHGTPKSTWYQEFWTFQRHGNAWQLHEVKESWDTGALTAPNRVAGLSDVELRNVERGVILL